MARIGHAWAVGGDFKTFSTLTLTFKKKLNIRSQMPLIKQSKTAEKGEGSDMGGITRSDGG